MGFLRKQRGSSSIIELIIVLGIIGILAGAFTHSYYSYVARTRVKTAIRNIIILKKSMDSMAGFGRCPGYPIRDNVTDLDEMLRIVDVYECKTSGDPLSQAPLIFPKKDKCFNYSLGSELLQTTPGAAGTVDPTALCASSCKSDDYSCIKNMGNFNFASAFITVSGESCSPDYGSASGPHYPGSYRPGWNYRLLYDGMPTTTNPRNHPVGVICGFALGYKTTIKIVINTGGFYDSTQVTDGTGIYDIDGDEVDAPSCPCGPWCQDMKTGKTGCCGPCGGLKGIGYKF